MFKKIILISVFAAMLLSLGGCDFFRKMAGRPTSADIAQKRAIIEKEEAGHRARLDSLKMVEKAMADSLSLIDSILAMQSSVIPAGSLEGLRTSKLKNHYYIVIGAFSLEANCEKMIAKAEARGYECVKIPFSNGFTSVGICGTDILAEAFASLRKVRTEAFCPSDVWVLVNE